MGYNDGYLGNYGTALLGEVTGLKVEVDWHKNGFDSGDDVTDLVRVDPGAIHLEYGRDQITALAPIVAGRGGIVLDNKDRRFSPRNTSSPLYGFIKPARPVRITRTLSGTGGGDTYGDGYSDTYGTGDATFTLFAGQTDENPINPDVEAKTASLSLVDGLAYFRGINITTSLYSGIRTGEAIGYILDACGWSAGLRDLDAGATVIPWWWEDGTDALTALDKVLRSEGPPALLTMGTSGEVIFMDRHHRLTNPASITSQGTWNIDGAAEPIMGVPFTYDDAWPNIINHGSIPVDVRTKREQEVVWSTDSPVKFTANQTKSVIATATDPFMDAVVPVSDRDYTVNSGSLSSITLSRTSGASTTITIQAGAGGAQLSNLQLRAKPIQVAFTQQVTASDSSSIAAYGQRSFPTDLPWCNQYDAEAVLNTAIALRSQPLPVVKASFLLASETRAAALLPRNMSDRVTIVEPETALNDGFYIESFAHDLSGEYDHTVTVGCELVPPAGTVTPTNVFVLGGGVGHRLGDGKLAA